MAAAYPGYCPVLPAAVIRSIPVYLSLYVSANCGLMIVTEASIDQRTERKGRWKLQTKRPCLSELSWCMRDQDLYNRTLLLEFFGRGLKTTLRSINTPRTPVR